MKTIRAYLARFPIVAAIGYMAVVAAFLAATWFHISDFLERSQLVAETSNILSHLEGRAPASSRANAHGTPVVTGSPVLEGPTVTVAGAALLTASCRSGNTGRWQHFIFPSRSTRGTIQKWVRQGFGRL